MTFPRITISRSGEPYLPIDLRYIGQARKLKKELAKFDTMDDKLAYAHQLIDSDKGLLIFELESGDYLCFRTVDSHEHTNFYSNAGDGSALATTVAESPFYELSIGRTPEALLDTDWPEQLLHYQVEVLYPEVKEWQVWVYSDANEADDAFWDRMQLKYPNKTLTKVIRDTQDSPLLPSPTWDNVVNSTPWGLSEEAQAELMRLAKGDK